ncbi:MAG: glycine cleavage system aminomethyltransferase GcvT [Fimbriimonadaceae bacterium]|nr:glycine cleavage system aminomethyltransferase GcvT [Fimbriimonadaceae bacterium]
MTLQRTPLYQRHVALGGRLVEFGGWEMPVQYSGIVAEHLATRRAMGLFDVSHMGEFELRGPGAVAFLERAVSNRVADLAVGRCRYALLCNEAGGVLDDLLYYRLAADHLLLVVNAGNIAGDLAWLQGLAPSDCELTDQSAASGLLALQGPGSRDLLVSLLGAAGETLAGLRYYQFATFELAGAAVLISRTGYTGGPGYELCCPAEAVGALWDLLLAAGAPTGLLPVGLGARDTLRLEAGFCLHGHELTPRRNPLEAGLARFVDLGQPFVGRDALAAVAAAGPADRLTGVEVVGRGVIREGAMITVGGEPCGSLTSGTFSPLLERSIGLGYVPAALPDGAAVEVLVRGKPLPCRLTTPPFYKP